MQHYRAGLHRVPGLHASETCQFVRETDAAVRQAPADCSMKTACPFHPGYGWQDSGIQVSSGHEPVPEKPACPENEPAFLYVWSAVPRTAVAGSEIEPTQR